MVASRWLRFRSLALAALAFGLTSSCCLFREFGEAFGRAVAAWIEMPYAAWSPWSPDSQSLLFGRPHSQDSDLNLLPLDGSAPRLIAQGSFFTPRWSPDGTAIVFASQQDPHDLGSPWDLWIMSADGSNRRCLATALQTVWFSPAWSPDGQWIAYDTDTTIELVRPDASQRRWLGPGWLPVWSPDGTRIASAIADEDPEVRCAWIQVMQTDGSGTARLTTGMNPSWSPDGTKLVFEDVDDEAEGMNRAVLVLESDGSNRRRLCDGLFPRWSPLGDRILVQRADATLVTIAPDGTDERMLTEKARFGRWSPDGQWIAFQWAFDVHVIRADGSGRRSLGLAAATQASEP